MNIDEAVEEAIINVLISDFKEALDTNISEDWARSFFSNGNEFWPAFDDKMVSNLFQYYELDLKDFSILSQRDLEEIEAAVEDETFVQDFCSDFTIIICTLSISYYYAYTVKETIAIFESHINKLKEEEEVFVESRIEEIIKKLDKFD